MSYGFYWCKKCNTTHRVEGDGNMQPKAKMPAMDESDMPEYPNNPPGSGMEVPGGDADKFHPRARPETPEGQGGTKTAV